MRALIASDVPVNMESGQFMVDVAAGVLNVEASGGGVTVVHPNERGGVSDIRVMTNGLPQTDRARDVNGALINQTGADVLMHEVLTEILPYLAKGAPISEFSRSFGVENRALNELGKPQRGSDPDHRF